MAPARSARGRPRFSYSDEKNLAFAKEAKLSRTRHPVNGPSGARGAVRVSLGVDLGLRLA